MTILTPSRLILGLNIVTRPAAGMMHLVAPDDHKGTKLHTSDETDYGELNYVMRPVLTLKSLNCLSPSLATSIGTSTNPVSSGQCLEDYPCTSLVRSAVCVRKLQSLLRVTIA